MPALLALLDVTVDDPEWQALDPASAPSADDRRRQAPPAPAKSAPATPGHHRESALDRSGTQAFLDSLIESLPSARLLLLVNYRPEYQHGWGRKTYYTQLRLDPLSTETAEEFLAALLGDASDLQPVKQLLIARTEGNPFFLEESIRALWRPRSWSVSGVPIACKNPVEHSGACQVQAILAARTDRLPPEEKHLLQCAAVIGRDVSFPLLQAIADLPEDDLHRGLTHLQTAEFLYETSLFPELEYTFKHALTQEVAYGSLLQERRRALHARIVDIIERLYGERLTSHIERLAYHAFRGEVWAKAVTYFRQAGIKATARSAYREAVVCFEQALAALKHLPESHETFASAFDLRMELTRRLVRSPTTGEFWRTCARPKRLPKRRVTVDGSAWCAPP